MKKISERADELYQKGQESDFYGRKNNEISLLTALGVALDEWQASVEERLQRNEPSCVCGNTSPKPLTGAAHICMLPPGHSGPHSEAQGPLPMMWGGAAEFASLPKKPFQIQDSGPSRYDGDPSEPEHQ